MKKTNLLKLLAAFLVSAALPQQLLSASTGGHAMISDVHEDDSSSAKSKVVTIHNDKPSGKIADGGTKFSGANRQVFDVSRTKQMGTTGTIVLANVGDAKFPVTATYNYQLASGPMANTSSWSQATSGRAVKAALNSQTPAVTFSAGTAARNQSKVLDVLANGKAVNIVSPNPFGASAKFHYGDSQNAKNNILVTQYQSAGLFGVGSGLYNPAATAKQVISQLFPNASVAQRASLAAGLVAGQSLPLAIKIQPAAARSEDYHLSVKLVTGAGGGTYVVVGGVPTISGSAADTGQACMSVLVNALASVK